ncbi:hypothetical protein PIB30_054442 [Stylosanthes scabra]|uniref:Uncharacterized protein n=1 Tax=Stylosanthes scabra TaxID=79078 RepID=A0ABU6SJ29_9FABA|nr:hypothetical protein [Stylosanthes scabra]
MNDLDIELVFSVIRRQGTNWANNPADDTIPERKLDDAILNAQATAWHKFIIENVDPKQHGTIFDLNHAILIYVLMTEGVVNLPRIMRDVLLKLPMGNSRNLLPYPIFISRLASRFQRQSDTFSATTACSARRTVATTTDSLRDPLHFYMKPNRALTPGDYEAFGEAGATTTPTESSDPEHANYDPPGTSRCSLHWVTF